MGVAMAIKTQARITIAPIVALLDWTSAELALRSQATRDESHRNRPSPLPPPLGEVGDVSGSNDLDPPVMMMIPVA